MTRLLMGLLLLAGLWLGSASSAQAQRGRFRRPPAPRGYRPHGPGAYGPRYHHAAPYRSYGGRNYYRRRPGPTVIIRR